jgi:hypothetical protein
MQEDKPAPAQPDAAQPTAPTTQEEEVWACLESARQQVRPLIKREVEGEPVTKELLNLRLKSLR